MIIIGLTGSIGMGKSTVAAQFKQFGASVCDSDRIVHGLLGKNGDAVTAVGSAFPAAREGHSINRAALAKVVFGDEEQLKRLEAILHPLVHRAQQQFIRAARLRGKSIAVLDIPLLFETGADARCDYTVVATAPAFMQKQRVLRRLHMSEEKLARILARQMPDREKCKRADFIVQTGLGKYASRKAVGTILLRIMRPPDTYLP